MTLYHYTSNEAFVSIVNSKTIQLSHLSLSNDYLEGKWVRKILKDHCEEKKIKTSQVEKLIKAFDLVSNHIGACGFCFSNEKDLLSQWRGFADSGKGVSIGFNEEFIRGLIQSRQPGQFPLQLIKILYDEESQQKLIEKQLEELIDCLQSGVFDYSERNLLITYLKDKSEELDNKINRDIERIFSIFSSLLPHLYRLKNPAFQEEREERLVATVLNNPSLSSRDSTILKHFEFHARGKSIIPFIEVPFRYIEIKPFDKIVLGPRNQTPPNFIREWLLGKAGYSDVEVEVSSASWR